MNKLTWTDIKPTVLLCILVWVLMFLAALSVDRQLPEDARVPMHWNIKGEVDRYGSKVEGLYLLPGLTAVMILIFALVPLIEPRRRHLQLSLKAYKIIISAIIIFMAVIHGLILWSTMGKQVDIGRLVNLGIGILFVLLGNYLGKVRSNFFLGVRTPWTLSSELSWSKTHRLAGWLFVILGLLVLINVAFWEPQRAFIIMIGGVIICGLVPYIYSYFIWKKDNNRQVRS